MESIQSNLGGSSEDEAKLVHRLWVAGLASTHLDLQSRNSLREQIDIDWALSFVRNLTLNNEQMSLYDLSTLMLGLSRMVSDQSQMLSVTANQQQNDISNTFGLMDNFTREQEPNNGPISNSFRAETKNQFVLKKPNTESKRKPTKLDKKRKFRFDEKTQLTEMAEEDAMMKRAKVVPSFGLTTAKQMGLYRESVHHMRRPVRELSPKLAYLFARNANVNKSKDKHRSLTCDNLKGKRVRLACGEHDKHHLSASGGQLSWPYQWLEDGEITCVDRPLDLLGIHYLSVRYGHLLAHRTVLNTAADKIVDSDDARATASIKSIMFGQRTSHCHVSSWQTGQSNTVVQTLLPLITSSCGGRTFEVEHLTRLASRGALLTKQLIALHFAGLLELADQGAIKVSQLPVTSLMDSNIIPKLYFSSK